MDIKRKWGCQGVCVSEEREKEADGGQKSTGVQRVCMSRAKEGMQAHEWYSFVMCASQVHVEQKVGASYRLAA